MRIYSLRYPKSKERHDLSDLIDKHIEYLAQSTDTAESIVTLEYAVFGKKYRRATWTVIFLSIVWQESGIYAILMYATRFLEIVRSDTEADEETSMLPLHATIIFGIVNFLGVLFSLIPIYFYGRKKTLVYGYGSMAVALGLAGLSIVLGWYIMSFIFICFFILFFQIAAASTIPIYSAEISILSKNAVFPAKGLARTVSFLCLTQISLTMEFMMGIWGTHITMFFYASINLIACLLILALVKETKGLTDDEKKLIYSPISLVSEQKLSNFHENEKFATFQTKIVAVDNQKKRKRKHHRHDDKEQEHKQEQEQEQEHSLERKDQDE